jgi:hypothetical protein
MLGAGTMILPDVGLTFFWMLALLFLEQIFVKNDFSIRNWFFAGLCTGLAMLSKYHGGMLGISVAIFLLLRYPRQLFRPGFWLFGVSALAVFTPVILWNAQHDFVSFLFQGGRAVGGNLSLNRFLQALAGQIAYLTPLIFAPLFYQMFKVTRNAIRKRDSTSLFITIFGVVPVVFILLISISKPILPHWTLPGYIVLMLPLSRWLAELIPINRAVRLASWITVGFIGIILILLVLHTRFGIFHLEKLAQRGWISQKDAQMDATLDAFGWEQVPVWVSEKYGDKQPFIFTNKWFLSGEVALAVQGRYPVLCFNEKDARGFGFWDAAKDMRGKDGIFICSSRYPLEPAQLYSEYFENISEADSIIIYRGEVPAKVLYFYHCRNLIKRYPLPYQNKTTPD